MNAPLTTSQRFARLLDTSIHSGAGVIFIKTAEPHRATDIISTLVGTYDQFIKERQPDIGDTGSRVAVWKMTTGSVDWEVEPHEDGYNVLETADPLQTMKAFATLGTNDKPAPFDSYNFLVMNWLSFALGHQNAPPIIQAISDYYFDLPHVAKTDANKNRLGLGKRLLVLVPSEYEVPEHLEQLPQIKLERPDITEFEYMVTDILENGMQDQSKVPGYNEADIRLIASNAKGMTEVEANEAISAVFYEVRGLLPDFPADEFGRRIAERKVRSVEKNPVLKVLQPIPLDQIGGLEVIKEDMRLLSTCMTQEAYDDDIAPKGIFLAGPPGTGKSLVGKAVSQILDVPLIQFDLSAVKDKFVGESGRKARAALDIVNSVKPCVVLVDEVDKAISISHGDTGGSNSDVLGTLLTEMQEVDGVFWIFTANRTQGLPAELLRRGRMDELYSVSTPNPIEREKIFEIHLRKRGVEVPTDLVHAVNASEDYVPAELEDAVKKAIRYALDARGTKSVTGEEIADVLRVMKPLSRTHEQQFNEMREWAEENARAASAPYTPVEQVGDNVSQMPSNRPPRRERLI